VALAAFVLQRPPAPVAQEQAPHLEPAYSEA
jgi:hypothetical protein